MPPPLVHAPRGPRARRETAAQALRDPGTPTDASTFGENLAALTRVYLTWPRALLCALALVILVGGRGADFLLLLLGLTLWLSACAVGAGARGLGLAYHLTTDRLFAGGRARIDIAIVNRSRWPVPLCQLAARLPDGLHGHFRQVLTLAPRSTRRAVFEVTAIHRGVYRLGDTRVVLSDWFGLFQETADVPVPGRLLVYPAAAAAPAARPLRRLPTGPRRDPVSPFPDDTPWGVRPYRPGDPLRAVAWKQTAHRGALLVREYPRVRESATWIYVDLCSADWDPLYRRERTEAAIATAADLLREEVGHHRAVGLATWGAMAETTVHGLEVTSPPAWIRLAPRADPGQAPRLLGVLAAVQAAPGPDFADRLRLEGGALPWGARIVALVPRDTPELWALGAAWVGRGHPVTLLVFERRLGRPVGMQARRVPEIVEVGHG